MGGVGRGFEEEVRRCQRIQGFVIHGRLHLNIVTHRKQKNKLMPRSMETHANDYKFI